MSSWDFFGFSKFCSYQNSERILNIFKRNLTDLVFQNIVSEYGTIPRIQRHDCHAAPVPHMVAIHDGFDPKIQAVKMADVWVMSKSGGVSTRLVPSMATLPPRRVPQHFDTVLKTMLPFVRNEELCEAVVARTQP